MTIFEHSFTLIGLVLGLALADVLGGLVRAGRTHKTQPIGVLTPMLAIFVILDVTTFWGILWDIRGDLPSVWPVLGIGVVLTAMYYSAAALVFPDSREQWSDLNAYYMRNRRVVLGLMLLCYLIVVSLLAVQRGEWSRDWVSNAYIVVMALTILAPGRVANIAGLGALIVVDLCAFFVLS